MSEQPGEALAFVDDPDRGRIERDVEDFLRGLGRSTMLRIPGRDRSRARAVSTLIHGNEPSGTRAVHGWLRSGVQPQTDVLFWIASVATALGPPLFGRRTAPGQEDLNRCFLAEGSGSEARALAQRALRALRGARPEALIDLHNNTGHNPSYAVGCHPGRQELGLAGLFGRYFVHSQLELGALVEATQHEFPSVTIECGRAGDPGADAVARAGLDRFLSLDAIASAVPPPDMRLLVDPVRVRIRKEIAFAVAERAQPGADFTAAADLDRHNFELLEPGVVLGWLREGCAWPLTAEDAQGRELSHRFFARRDDRLEVRQSLIPIMMTTKPEIAASDCLFYLVRPAEG